MIWRMQEIFLSAWYVFMFSVWTFSACFSRSRSWWWQAKQSRSSVLLPKHVLQRFLWDCMAVQNHIRYVIPPVRYWSPPGGHIWTCLWDASWSDAQTTSTDCLQHRSSGSTVALSLRVSPDTKWRKLILAACIYNPILLITTATCSWPEVMDVMLIGW